MIFRRLALTVALIAAPTVVSAQAPADFRQEFLMQFNSSMQKFLQLANAMPAEKFTWSPDKGVMEVGQVYMHVARYNYAYPTQSLGATLPAGIVLNTMESVRDKAAVIKALRESAEFVRAAANRIPANELGKQTQLYGRNVGQWAVMLQLLAHMNEHLGQSIAYARMNKIVPPWSS